MFDEISLERIKKYISFAGKNMRVFADNTIPDLQSKGVTALCKILHKRQYAYLADEVGMGKTYQALGVISMLLAEKPNAQILIIAPNEAVQRNWDTEIRNFSNKNLCYDSIRFSVELNHPVEMIKNFHDGNKETNIRIVRLTSFSTIGEHIVGCGKRTQNAEISVEKLTSGLEEITKVDKKIIKKEFSNVESIESAEAGKICGRILRRYSPLFDLVVVDEAQNLRNKNNATQFFNCWMGLRRWGENFIYEDRKYLLMSATPAHRGVESLRYQLEYFETKTTMPEMEHSELEKFLIRRLRTYNGDSKYQVRHVNADDVIKDDGGEESVEQRLFLALLQSRLVQLQGAVKNNATFKIGFLETFESYNPNNQSGDDDETGEREKEFENGGSQKEDEKGTAPDKQLMMQLAKSYMETFDKPAPHPKFGYMESETTRLINTNIADTYKTPSITPDKALVFVRRLASVDELVLRLNKLYEQGILDYWGAILKTKPGLNDIQTAFQRKYIKLTKQDGAEEQEDEEFDDLQEDPRDKNVKREYRSELLSWLAIKKNDKDDKEDYRNNAVSLFKKSMMRNRSRSYLFEENYYRTAFGKGDYKKRVERIVNADFVKEINDYIKADTKRFISNNSNKKKYNTSELLVLCCYVALKNEGKDSDNQFKDFFRIKDKVDGNEILLEKTMIKKILLQTSVWNCLKLNEEFQKEFNEYEFKKKYVIKAMIEKYLKSSEAVLELLFCACEISNPRDKRALCNKIVKRVFDSKSVYGKRIIQLINNRELVFNQIVVDDKIDYKYDPTFMNVQNWVMPAVGGNKGNEALIKRFNTPFYPDIIVCTDVLKEGINLHLFCNKVYHYGLAWTPGDLEQRIGRVDRFFGKTYRERINKVDSHIEIFYPYMGKSIDEHQLRRVLQFKLSADPLLDSSSGSSKVIDAFSDELISIDELASYIPSEDERTNFPYSGELFWSE